MSRRARAIALLLIAMASTAIVFAAPLFGESSVTLSRVFDSSIPADENLDRVIFVTLRLSRALFAGLVGGVLALAGCVFQVALRNDLATPYTLGVSGAASFGALLAIQFGAVGAGVAVGSLAGGLAAVTLILALARLFAGREGTVALLLAGVTLNLLFGAMILVLQYLADPYQTFQIVRWMMGGVDVTGLAITGWLLLAMGVPLLLILASAPALNLLELDDLSARSLGINPDRRRLVLLGASSVLVALAVGFAGPIGFVGLIIPHAVRRLLGTDSRFALPACFFMGGGFLAFADTVSRLIGGDLEIPVGIVTALIGGPAFLYILVRKASGWRS